MDRRPPRTTSDEIDLYIRTYYSLLRSTGEVRVSAFEEAHGFSDSSLHAGAREQAPDLAAFAYAAARLPDCFPSVRRVVLGQSPEPFDQAGVAVRTQAPVRARGRRRAMRWDGAGTLAVFVTSTSDIDDLLPILTAYQIEWHKLHALLAGAPAGADGDGLVQALGLEAEDAGRLRAALGPSWRDAMPRIAAAPCDLSVRLLAGSFNQYQTTAQRWWRPLERAYLGPTEGRRRPVYFVSSNTHSLLNLVGGYARSHRERIIDFARKTDPEGLAGDVERALAAGEEGAVSNLLYYLLRAYLDHGEEPVAARLAEVQAYDAESGIASIESPGNIDVSARVIELRRLQPERLDPRVRVPGIERLAGSDAVVLNIDYPLGMAAYHHLSRVAQGVNEVRGVYVMGKAATLNARVGDVMISNAVYDEHSKNTYLLRNCFGAADVQPWLHHANVFDHQKAVTVKSAFLQNRDYMSLFYAEGYTVLEM